MAKTPVLSKSQFCSAFSNENGSIFSQKTTRGELSEEFAFFSENSQSILPPRLEPPAPRIQTVSNFSLQSLERVLKLPRSSTLGVSRTAKSFFAYAFLSASNAGLKRSRRKTMSLSSNPEPPTCSAKQQDMS